MDAGRGMENRVKEGEGTNLEKGGKITGLSFIELNKIQIEIGFFLVLFTHGQFGDGSICLIKLQPFLGLKIDLKI